MINVLIADDHTIVRQGLKQILAGDPQLAVIGEAANGDEVLRAGECAGFKAGDENGHCLQNRSKTDATVLAIGTRTPGGATAPGPPTVNR